MSNGRERAKTFVIMGFLLLMMFGAGSTRGDWVQIQGYNGTDWLPVNVTDTGLTQVILLGEYNDSQIEVQVNEHGELIPLTHVENAVHTGDHYYVDGYATLGSGETLNVSFVTPSVASGKLMHFKFTIESSLILTTEFWENVTSITGGVNSTVLNNNRALNHSSEVVLTKMVGPLVGGTLISSGSWGAKKVGGGGVSIDDELILAPGTRYGRVFTSGSAANIIYFKANWIEHEC